MVGARKGQISWFVALGIVMMVIAGVSVWIWLNLNLDFGQSDKLFIEDELSKVKSYIQRCEKDVAEEAITIIGLQGGKIIPSNYLKVQENKIEYVYNKKVVLLSIDDMEQELRSYINNKVSESCVPLNNTKRVVTTGKVISDVKIYYDSVLFQINWPVIVQFDNNTKKSFSLTKIRLPVRLGRIHETVSQDLTQYDETILNDIEAYDEIDIKKKLEGNNVLAILVDHESKLNNRPYRFFYAIRNVNKI